MGELYLTFWGHYISLKCVLGSRLRHCATRWKAMSSITNGVSGIFHWFNPSGRTTALGSTRPLTQTSTSNVSWGKRGMVHRAHNLATFMCRLSRNSRSLKLLERSGPVKAGIGIAFTFVWNDGNRSPSTTVPHCRRTTSSETVPWEPQTLYMQELRSGVLQTKCCEMRLVCKRYLHQSLQKQTINAHWKKSSNFYR